MTEHSKVPAILTFLLTFMVAGVIGYQLWKTKTITDSYLTGQLVTAWIASVQYWFGTTRSSADKTHLIVKEKTTETIKPDIL